MIKLDSLRAAILEANPALKNAADSLKTFADEGNITATHGEPIGWRYEYRATLLVQDYPGHPDSLIDPLINWVARFQPDLLHNHTAIKFQSEVLSETTCDFVVELQLSEPVRVTTNADGRRIAEHLMPEEEISYTIWLREDQILPGALPDPFEASPHGGA